MSDLQDDAVDSLASTLQSTLSLSPLQSPPTAKPSAQVANSNSTATVLLQPSCLEHRYIRNRDMASIVERPERLKAVCTGVAAALAASLAQTEVTLNQDDDIVKRLEAINLSAVAAPPTLLSSPYIQVLSSTATLDILTHKAVVYVHGDDAYLTQLKGWVSDSEEKIKEGESEIPQGYSQGDLYLCPQSVDAMAGALATTCEAVDLVVQEAYSRRATAPSPTRVFAAIRPPGHHCSDDAPSGFCFVNNVVVGAAHAYLQHGINRAIILDIDLHHGNGTQALAFSINQEAHRRDLENAAKRKAAAHQHDVEPKMSNELKIYYASLHDILSFPCEDGDPLLVQAASTSLHSKEHGQYIENVHLEPYTSDDDFYERHYDTYKAKLLNGAKRFLASEKGSPNKTMVFVSAGFDASPHEYSSMSRHNRHVPTSFFNRFAKDVSAFADDYAAGKVVSVLEGGYSDRGLVSGVGAWVEGLGGLSNGWWDDIGELTKLEKILKRPARNGTPGSAPKPRHSNPGTSSPTDQWIIQTQTILSAMDPRFFAPPPPSTTRKAANPIPLGVTLRDRTTAKTGSGPVETPASKPTPEKKSKASPRRSPVSNRTAPSAESSPDRKRTTPTHATGQGVVKALQGTPFRLDGVQQHHDAKAETTRTAASRTPPKEDGARVSIDEGTPTRTMGRGDKEAIEQNHSPLMIRIKRPSPQPSAGSSADTTGP